MDLNFVSHNKESIATSMPHSENVFPVKSTIDTPSFVISNPEVIQENMRSFLPSYTEVLTRNPGESVRLEDLDQLQMDLEYLLSTVVLQRKTLRFKRKLFTHSKNERKLTKIKNDLISKQRRKNKKMRFKHKLPAVTKTLMNDITIKRDIARATVVKKDTSDRYWLSVEPLCGDITKDNTVFLNNMIRECSRNIEVTIPEVGKNFFSEWNKTALANEQSLSCTQKSLEQTALEELYKESNFRENSVIPNSLGNCLLKAFMKENLIMGTSHNTSNRCGQVKKLKPINRFHKLLRQAFRKTHLKEEAKAANVEDEVLCEIKNSISQLQLMNDYNLIELKNLKEIALKDLKKQEVKESLDVLDEEIMTIYSKFVTLKDEHSNTVCKLNAEDAAHARNILQQQTNFLKEFADLTVSVID